MSSDSRISDKEEKYILAVSYKYGKCTFDTNTRRIYVYRKGFSPPVVVSKILMTAILLSLIVFPITRLISNSYYVNHLEFEGMLILLMLCASPLIIGFGLLWAYSFGVRYYFPQMELDNIVDEYDKRKV